MRLIGGKPSASAALCARVRRHGFAARQRRLLYPSRPLEIHLEPAMGLDLVSSGKDVPHEINVVIEIPKDADPVKYEVDKKTGAIFVDRVLSTPMRYPCNYGYVPHTLCGDGDPVDVLVLMPLPLIPGAVIRCRPVAMLQMTDEAGADTKIVAAPALKVFAHYDHIN